MKASPELANWKFFFRATIKAVHDIVLLVPKIFVECNRCPYLSLHRMMNICYYYRLLTKNWTRWKDTLRMNVYKSRKLLIINGTTYSRMDQVKFVGDNLYCLPQIWLGTKEELGLLFRIIFWNMSLLLHEFC